MRASCRLKIVFAKRCAGQRVWRTDPWKGGTHRAAGQIPSNKLFEDDKILAFYDIDPQAPVHFLVIPKTHIDSAAKLGEEDGALLAHVFATIARLCDELGCEKGYRVVTNVGEDGGQCWQSAASPGLRADKMCFASSNVIQEGS